MLYLLIVTKYLSPPINSMAPNIRNLLMSYSAWPDEEIANTLLMFCYSKSIIIVVRISLIKTEEI